MTYRFYFLKNGRIWAPPQTVECNGDEDAIAQARAVADGLAVEVWQHERLVACLDRRVPDCCDLPA